MTAETMLRNLGEATREAVYTIADGTGGGRNERLVLYRAFAIALCYDAFRCDQTEKIALTTLLTRCGTFFQIRPRSAKSTRAKKMPRTLTVKARVIERHRENWKVVARENGWFERFKKDGFALQIFVDARSGRVTDSIYRADGARGDIFSNASGRRLLSVAIASDLAGVV